MKTLFYFEIVVPLQHSYLAIHHLFTFDVAKHKKFFGVCEDIIVSLHRQIKMS